MPFPQRAVQSGHAIIEAQRAGLISHEIEHPHLIILEVAHEGKLRAAADRLRAAGLRLAEWHEPDRDNELTSICSEVVHGDTRKLFDRYTLLQTPCAQPPATVAGDCRAHQETIR